MEHHKENEIEEDDRTWILTCNRFKRLERLNIITVIALFLVSLKLMLMDQYMSQHVRGKNMDVPYWLDKTDDDFMTMPVISDKNIKKTSIESTAYHPSKYQEEIDVDGVQEEVPIQYKKLNILETSFDENDLYSKKIRILNEADRYINAIHASPDQRQIQGLKIIDDISTCEQSLISVKLKLSNEVFNYEWVLRDHASDALVIDGMHQISNTPDFLGRNESIQTYSLCLSPGKYLFEVLGYSKDESVSCGIDGNCFGIFISETSIINDNDLPFNSPRYFLISEDGSGHELKCPNLPILSPSNFYNDFVYEQKISSIMEMIYSISAAKDVQDTTKPQYKAACSIIYDGNLNITEIDEYLIEYYAFTVFLFATNQEVESLLKSPCDYDKNQVQCSDKGFIKALNYANSDLSGFIASEVAHLRHLEIINMSENNLEGTIPTDLGALVNLKELRLLSNQLSGTIFTEIGNLLNLRIIDVKNNALEGELPSHLGRLGHLTILDMSHNDFRAHIPSELYNLIRLTCLDFSDNDLKGTISPLIRSFQQIKEIRIFSNEFSSVIPTEIGHLSFLDTLVLNSNLFTGPLPSEIGNLHSLQTFGASQNELSSSIPDVFDGLSKLNFVDLTDNRLSGPLPGSLLRVQSLKTLLMEENLLTGSIPKEYCDSGIIPVVDNLDWFTDNPKINCECCEKKKCFIWEVEKSDNAPTCHEDNIYELKYFKRNEFLDLITNINSTEEDFSSDKYTKKCLSPTGCYKIRYLEDIEDSGIRLIDYNMSFSSETNSLEVNGSCDAVTICGKKFSSTHPRRAALNHLAQILSPDFINANDTRADSLCWLMTQDELFEKYNICDGTLSQRFLIEFFVSSVSKSTDIRKLGALDTCQWPGIVCDAEGKYVEELLLSKEGLNGKIVRELGLLPRLKVVDLSDNNLIGTLDPKIFTGLPLLEVFNVAGNNLGGNLPNDLFSRPLLAQVNVSRNKFVGTIPDSIVYSTNIEQIIVSKNILTGQFPLNLFHSHNLKQLDVSQNGLRGSIPKEVGSLKNLEILSFQLNKFSGSIPVELFNSNSILKLLLNGNRLTGSVPTEIGNLHNVTHILLNENALRKIIPSELSNLKNVQVLHLHHNKFEGSCPQMGSPTKEIQDYVTDCDSNILSCSTCTICCQSKGPCKTFDKDETSLVWWTVLYAAFIPIGTALYFSLIQIIQKKGRLLFHGKIIDPSQVVRTDSVYGFLFTKSWIAWCIQIIIIATQLCLFGIFLWASDPKNIHSNIASRYVCTSATQSCVDIATVNGLGWFIFFFIVLLYTGLDMVQGLIQIRFSMSPIFSLRLLANGALTFAIAITALTSSRAYNNATATNNTDLVVNAVILLFVNDLDEQALALLEKVVPLWLEERISEIEVFMKERAELVNMNETNAGVGSNPVVPQNSEESNHLDDVFSASNIDA